MHILGIVAVQQSILLLPVICLLSFCVIQSGVTL